MVRNRDFRLNWHTALSGVVLLAVCAGSLLMMRPDATRAAQPLPQLSSATPSPFAASPRAATRPSSPDQVEILSTIPFGKGGDTTLFLDMSLPPSGKGPFPAVVCLHGGGWEIGHRITHQRTIRLLAYHGYVAVTVDYRLAPQHKFPAQLEDAKCAVRFLRANAAKYNLDPTRIAALGDSAGGHLALLLGLMDPPDGLEGSGGWAEQSSKVQAVVNYFGLTDLANWKVSALVDQVLVRKYGRRADALLEGFLGTADRSAAVVRQASPVAYIDAKDPPVITFQGMLDPLVPAEQALLLHTALRSAGVEQALMTIPTGAHGWKGPDRQRTDRRMIEFLDRLFKRAAAQASSSATTRPDAG